MQSLQKQLNHNPQQITTQKRYDAKIPYRSQLEANSGGEEQRVL